MTLFFLAAARSLSVVLPEKQQIDARHGGNLVDVLDAVSGFDRLGASRVGRLSGPSRRPPRA